MREPVSTSIPAIVNVNLLFRRLAWCMLLLLAAIAVGLVVSSRGLDVTGGDILWQMRAPRVAMAVLAGAAMAGAGVAFQALLRNPLADPYIIGVSGGAALGGTMALLVAGSAVLVPILSFVGAVVATLGAWAFARRMGGGVFQILMTGVVINAFAASLISFVKTVVSAAKAQEILFWLMGTLGYPSWHAVALTSIAVATGLAILITLGPAYNVMSFGEQHGEALGVSITRVRAITFVAGALVVGAVVAHVGMIGFIGLVVPHLVRLMWGPDHRLLLPAAIILGAAALVMADTIARSSFMVIGTTLPAGVITSFFGGPFFIVLLLRHRRRWTVQ